MAISKEQVSHVARLARLSFTDDELDRFTDQLSKILDHAAQVADLTTEDVPPTAHPFPMHNVFRQDVVEPCLPRDKAMSTAPDEEDGRFRVPRIIEERS